MMTDKYMLKVRDAEQKHQEPEIKIFTTADYEGLHQLSKKLADDSKAQCAKLKN